MTQILVIEDDVDMARQIAECLEANGFRTQCCFDGTEGLRLALEGTFDAVTLDRMLPGCDGLTIARTLHDAGHAIPVLMLSAMANLDDRLAGLRSGGDDYVLKPFEPSELVVRLEVLLRRASRSPERKLALTVGTLRLDLVSREAHRGDTTIELLPMEFKLLEFMMRNAGQLLSRRMIFEHVWEYHFDPGTNLIDVHVGKLRRKIDEPGRPSFIRTERGTGYVLDAV
ncbi:MAG TPA: response regulator transcription factor [Steroidobacteraceae bacterium]|nr:response regulator transcription factor [Steroidobacteraceae bacterium]